MKKLGLVLGSGGAKGVAHVGALQALEDNGIKPDVITGCSAGSIVGACYAYGMTPKKIYSELKKLKNEDIVDVSLNFMRNRSVLKSAKVKTLLENYLADTLIEELPIPYGCIATDLNTGRIHEFTSGSLVTACRASSAIPVAFSPIELDGMLLVDGGISARLPIKTCRKLGADVILAVDVDNDTNYSPQIKGMITVALRSIDIMAHTLEADGQKKKTDIVLKPDLSVINQYKLEKVKYIYDKGYNCVIENIDKIKAMLSD